MDVDSLSRLIESANVSNFRTLCIHYLKYIGFSSAQYCDGPYDGGKDFWIETDTNGNVKCAIQLSVESDWRKKLSAEAKKIKQNYQSNILYFISSRRIPERSFADHSREILNKYNVLVTRYDNQAIATEFIKNNKVDVLLKIFGININAETHGIKKYLGPKNEAIASMLIFGEEAKELRSGLYESIIKSYMVNFKEGISRKELEKNILSDHELSLPQAEIINSNIDRLLQRKEIVKIEDKVKLSDSEFNVYKGLIESANFEAHQLALVVQNFFEKNNLNLTKDTEKLIIDNILEITVLLISESFEHINNDTEVRESYLKIFSILESETGKSKANEIFEALAKTVSETEFARHIAGAQLYISLLNTNSSQLIAALGGTESVNVYLDASVAIPLVCNVLFSAQKNRSGTSSKVLFDLISGHEFNAIIPDLYIEEMASHLIDACRDYKEILDLGEDLSYSQNAFVSHYSNYKTENKNSEIDFENYVSVFGVNIREIRHDMEYSTYFRIRDRVKSDISELVKRYKIESIEIPQKNSSYEISEINKELTRKNIYRPEILIKHDAHVIKYLSGTSVQSGYAKVLCTWDKIQSLINPDAKRGYFVISPIAIIDLFSIAKNSSKNYKFTHLIDFAKVQNEKTLMLSSKIWDKLSQIEKENFSDAELILKAKSFKEQYVSNANIFDEIDTEQIATAWLAWKNQNNG